MHALYAHSYLLCIQLQVDVDLVFSNGECTYGAVTDNWPTIEPYFNETGSNCPSILPIQTQRELIDLAVASVKVRIPASI